MKILMHSWLEKLACGIVAKRWWVITFFLLLVSTLGYTATKLQFDMSAEIWFLKNDPNLKNYQEFLAEFGDDEYLIILIYEDNGVLNNKLLSSVERITNRLRSMKYITKVTSLTTYETIRGVDDDLVIDSLIPQLPLSLTDLSMKEKVLKQERIPQRLLFSDDLKATVIFARTKHLEGIFYHKKQISKEVRGLLKKEKEQTGYQYYLSGGPILDDAFFTISLQDNTAIMPFLYLLIFLISFYLFRRVSCALLPLLIILFSVICILGLIVLLGSKLNNLTAIIPIILTAVGVADSIHILLHFLTKVRKLDISSQDAAVLTIKELFRPCFLTSFTTSVGFLSLTATPLEPLNQMGYLTALGVMIAFLLSLVFLPALLSFFRKGKIKETNSRSILMDRLLQRLPDFTFRNKRLIIYFFLLTTPLIFYFSLKIRVESNSLEFYKKKQPVRQATEFIQKNLGGIVDLEFVVDTDKPDGMKDPQLLKKIEKFQEFLNSIPIITKTISVVDYLKKINQEMNEGRRTFYTIPQSRRLIAQYLLLYSFSSPDEDLSDMISFDSSKLRILARTKLVSSSIYTEKLDEIDRFLDKELPGIKIKPTGLVLLYQKMENYLLRSLIISLLLALVIITILFFIFLNSLKLGLLAMLPNLIPILFSLGIMGFFGVKLDIGTALFACVSLGIAVDDTIHFLVRFQTERRKGLGITKVVEIVIAEAGGAIVSTSVILFFGFGTLILSDFVPNFYFGILAAITIVMALAADLFLLPAIIFSLRGDTPKDC